MADAFKNFAVSLIASAPSPATTGTTFTVQPGHGTRFPATPFNAVLAPRDAIAMVDNAEIVRVTNITGDTFTVVREQENTTAKAIEANWYVYQGTTERSHNDLLSTIDFISNALSNELSVRATQDNALSNALSNEISVRTANDNALSQAISVVSTALSNEMSVRAANDSALSNTLSNEISVRAANDNALSQAISVVSTALSNAISARVAADDALSNALSNAISARVAADNALSDALSVANARIVSVFGATKAVQNAQVISTNVLTDISGLNVSVDAGGIYHIRAQVNVSPQTLSAPLRLGLKFPPMVNTAGEVRGYDTSTGALGTVVQAAVEFPWNDSRNSVAFYSANIGSVDVAHPTFWEGNFAVSTAGVVQLLAAGSTGAGAIVIQRGSYVRIYKIG